MESGRQSSGKDSTVNILSLCPRELNLMKFVEARAFEMSTMSSLIGRSGRNNRVMQNLPIHMRRRAMSHNIKRFPKRLQLLAQSEMETMRGAVSSKRPRRVHRPRVKKRTKQAHIKHGRDSECIWLRTHIWHAKRFKMKTIWRHSFPYKQHEKCLRKVYRDIRRGTMMQDITHTCLYEIIGNQENIVEALGRMTNPATGARMDDLRYISGRQRGSTTLYKPDAYPRGCLGPVSFVWMPDGATSDVSPLINVDPGQRKLWIWSHPACSLDILATLQQVRHEYGYHLAEIGNNLVTFRLYGGASTQTLRDVLVSAAKRDGNDVIVDEIAAILEGQNGLGSDVFSTMVKYPTLYRKRNYIKVVEAAQIRIEDVPVRLPEHDPLSPLFWSDEARDTFNVDIAEKLRGRTLKTDLNLSDELANDNTTIPLLLFHIPPSAGSTLAPHGWELILPSNAAMLVWKAFIYHRVRPLGLFEWQNVLTELNFSVYPYSYPDTEAGLQYMQQQSETAKNDYDKRPPGKRPNFQALHVRDPFTCPWSKLVVEWMARGDRAATDCEGFYVLRDRNALRTIQLALDSRSPISNGLSDQHASALVPIHLATTGKGAPTSNAMISIPSRRDLDRKDEHDNDPEETLRKSVKSMALPSSRDVIGYLFLAGFSLSRGGCYGQGFVALRGLEELLSRNKDSRVLVRDTGTLQYRFARIRVDCEKSPILY